MRLDNGHWMSMSSSHYICIPCRYHLKVNTMEGGTYRKCPNGHDLLAMGKNFKAPRRSSRAWSVMAAQLMKPNREYGYYKGIHVIRPLITRATVKRKLTR